MPALAQPRPLVRFGAGGWEKGRLSNGTDRASGLNLWHGLPLQALQGTFSG
jgi:hypothetical protein